MNIYDKKHEFLGEFYVGFYYVYEDLEYMHESMGMQVDTKLVYEFWNQPLQFNAYSRNLMDLIIQELSGT